MVDAYWNIGRQIVEEEQKGEQRAEYGAYLLRDLAKFLIAELQNLGKGFPSVALEIFVSFIYVFQFGLHCGPN